jgi:nucleotide-binding universal stress UspA family protein
LARRLKLSIEFFRVIEAPEATPERPAGEAGEYLEELARTFTEVASVKCTIGVGNPATAIIDASGAEPNALVAMATHGSSGIQRWLLGSVAEKVLHAATSDVLLVRPNEQDSGIEAMLDTVLVPLDGSGLAGEILPTVARIVAALQLKTVLVHVMPRLNISPPDAFIPAFGMSPPMQNQIWREQRSAANNYLIDREEQLRSAGVPDVSSLLIEGYAGSAAGEIIDLARETSNVLIAMSTHGQSGIERWLIGSVTERVVRHSDKPVLVIRAKPKV